MAWVVVALGDVAFKVGGVAFDSGLERSSAVGDMVGVIHPHPWAVVRGMVEAAVGETHGVVVVRTREVMGQCLAMGGCQTLQLLLISVLIISKHYKAHLVG